MNKNRLLKRALPLVTVASLIGGIGVHDAVHNAYERHSSGELGKLPTQPVVIDRPDKGLDDAIFEVDPQAQNNLQLKTDLENYLSHHALNQAGNIEFGTAIRVPVVGHDQHSK